MSIVSTGQLTIVDQNDARTLTANIRVSPGKQQTYNNEDSVETYDPDWTAANGGTGLKLVARIFVGGVGAPQLAAAFLTNPAFSLSDGGTAIPGAGNGITTSIAAGDAGSVTMAAVFTAGTYKVTHSLVSGSTMLIDANMLSTVPNATMFFDADYNDPVTGIVSHVTAQTSLSVVRTGTNANYVITSGKTAIKKSPLNTKLVTAIKANLVRGSLIDTTRLEFQWYEDNGQTQITTGSTAGMYALKNVAEGTQPVGALGDLSTPNLPASNGWTSVASGGNTLVIHENIVVDVATFRVRIRDQDTLAIWQAYFTVTDMSDPYRTLLISSNGDKLLNGVGSTTITPAVYHGDKQVSSLTGWEFVWTMFGKAGVQSAFIDATRTAAGRNISANTTTTFTYVGVTLTSPAIVGGDIIKCVTPQGADYFYEVASVSGPVVTLRTASWSNTWLAAFGAYAQPAASQFVGGLFYVTTPVDGAAGRGERRTTGAASITVTGDDVDARARFQVTANRP